MSWKPEAKVLTNRAGVTLLTVPLPLLATSRLPEESNASSWGRLNPEAKVVLNVLAVSLAVSLSVLNCTVGSGSGSVMARVFTDGLPRLAPEDVPRVRVSVSAGSGVREQCAGDGGGCLTGRDDQRA